MKFTDLISEELTDADIKRVKTLYAFYKAGIHRVDVVNGSLYKYVLSNDYELSTSVNDGVKKILIEPKGMTMYHESQDGTFKEMDRSDYPSLERWIIRLIRKKFANYKIDIVII